MPAEVTAPVWHLAQANVARPRADLFSPVMSGFVFALEGVNRIAENSPGFVWRLRSVESHGATTVAGGLVVNLSVWDSYESLHAFVYRSRHGAFVANRARWFEPAGMPSTVLWWVRAGEMPAVEEALRRHRHLVAHGPTPQAFSLRRRFGPDGYPARRGERGLAARTGQM
ncbi:MAG TPA: DUF3291 domain-containing protein [Actinomycetota bacterium]|nr:DUF3291 domain-containing protein [Actinomycetota bacterium]